MSLSMSMSRAFGGVLLYPAIEALLRDGNAKSTQKTPKVTEALGLTF